MLITWPVFILLLSIPCVLFYKWWLLQDDCNYVQDLRKKRKSFSDLKLRIIEALKKKGDLGINEPVTLLDGFLDSPIQTELSGNLVTGGPIIPMVAVIGNNSGRIYLFALKALLPDID